MSSAAVAEVPDLPSPVAPPAPGLLQRVGALDRASLMRWGMGAALLVALAVGAFFFTRQPEYRVLFAGMNDKDGGAIVAQLAQMNVPYKYTEGGGAILVPAERVHDVRLRLATQGLPKGTVSGFEQMESGRFGVTQFQERLNFQRGLEGELTRSIQALASVQSARVHLALPQQNGFFREQQKPSASVLLSLYPGRFLDRAQLAGIVHLVSSSVPEMAPTAVSVLDDTGKLLSQSPDGNNGNSSIDTQQLMYVQQIEQQYARRIVELLEPVVGKNNVRAQVSAEVDFSRTESTIEQHRPNLAPDASAVRSQQVLESGPAVGPRTPTGVPGAVTNQPPQAAGAPVNGPGQQLSAGGDQDNATPGKRESVINYEVDKTTQVTRGSVGSIKRVNAAVVVNYASVSEGDGKPVPKALSPQQLEQMTALVRETVGFNKERGDSVNLMNAPFLVEEGPQPELPLWKQPETRELAKTLAWPLGISLAVAIVLIAVARPWLKARAKSKELALASATGTGSLSAIEGEDLERPALPAPDGSQVQELELTPEQQRLNDARALALENPMAVANILKTWVNGE